MFTLNLFIKLFRAVILVIIGYFPILGQAQEITSPAIEYWCQYFQDLGQDCIRIPAPPDENASSEEWKIWNELVLSILKPTIKIMIGSPYLPGYIQFVQSNEVVYEDNEKDGIYTFTVERLGGSDGQITVKYTITDGSAQTGRDFDATTGSLTWNDGDNSQQTFTVTITDDSEVENNETFDLVLTDVTDGTILETKTITIVSDDIEVSPGIIQFSKNNYEVFENEKTLTFTVKRSEGNTGKVTVNYFTNDGTAIVGHDFEPISGTLTWEDGENDDKTLTITLIDDDEVEQYETFTISLSDITGEATLGTAITLITIHSDDKEILPGIVQFSQYNDKVNETASHLTITVERTEGSDGKVTVKYTTNNGTALAQQDFEAISDTLTWEDGENDDKTVTITLKDDDEVEMDETFTVTLMDITGGASIGNEAITITLVSDDIIEPPTSTDTSIFTPQPPDDTVGPSTSTATNTSISQPPDDTVGPSTSTATNTSISQLPDDTVGPSTSTATNTSISQPPDDTIGPSTSTNTGTIPQPPDDTKLPTSTDTSISTSQTSPISTASDSDKLVDENHEPDELGTPSTTNPSNSEIVCIFNPEYSLQPAFQDFSMNIGDEAISQTFTGGQRQIQFIQPPNGQILTLLDYSFPEDGDATIQFEPREVGTTQFIIGDECEHQATVNITVNNKEVKEELEENKALEEIETRLDTCQSVSESPLKPEKNNLTMDIGESRILWFTGGQQKRWLSIPPVGNIVRLESTDFPEQGGAKLTLTATQKGETQLGISDCVGESIVNITVNDKILSCTSLPSEPQVILLEGETPLFKTFTGDQVKIIQPPDDTMVTLELPIFSEDGLTQLKLTPRKAGTTQITLSNCTGETVVNVTVLKRGTLAYTCQLAEKKDGLCENLEQIIEYNGLEMNPKGETIETTAYFAGKLNVTPESKNLMLGQTNEITAKLTLIVNEAHIGWSADILTVVEHQTNGKPPKFFMYDGTMWQPWLSSDLSSLVAIAKYKNIPAIVEISPDLKTLDKSPGKFTIYMGYRLENGTIIFNGKAQPQFWRANSEHFPSESEQNGKIRAYFAGNVQRKAQVLKSNMLTVTMTIKPDFEHLGERADIIIVAFYLSDHEEQKFGYMQLPSQEWHKWDSEIKNLVNAYNDEILKDNMEVKIFEDELNIPPGQIEIYVGYRLYRVSGNIIVFNGREPLIVNVP